MNKPQQNSPADKDFKTACVKAKASFVTANALMKTSHIAFPHWIKTASNLDNLCIVDFN